jgi:hypothetical protein
MERGKLSKFPLCSDYEPGFGGYETSYERVEGNCLAKNSQINVSVCSFERSEGGNSLSSEVFPSGPFVHSKSKLFRSGNPWTDLEREVEEEFEVHSGKRWLCKMVVGKDIPIAEVTCYVGKMLVGRFNGNLQERRPSRSG